MRTVREVPWTPSKWACYLSRWDSSPSRCRCYRSFPLQLVGAAVGAGASGARAALKKMDYRADMFSTIGIVSSVIGILLCLFVPVLFIIANIAKLVA